MEFRQQRRGVFIKAGTTWKLAGVNHDVLRLDWINVSTGGISPSLTTPFNATGVPEPSSALLCGFAVGLITLCQPGAMRKSGC